MIFLGGKIVEVDPRKAKPSQYDHTTHTYVKKTLKQRWHLFSNGTKVQRDLYSSFLLLNVDERTGLIDQNQCIKHFQHFLKQHQIEMERVKQLGSNVSAFGI